MMRVQERRQEEAGFAMLVVFLLAAFVAISLYMELPRVVFESQRNREQTLIDRGEQYRRAIQLYYRRYGRYPQDLKALENTDNRHFLRHRYKDPMTDKDEWRLIHAAAPGVFPDSLVYKTPGQKEKTDSGTTTASAETTPAPWMQRRPSDTTLPPGQDQGAPVEPSMDNPPDQGAMPAGPQPGVQGTAMADQQRPPGFPAIVPAGQMYPVQFGATPGQQPGLPSGFGIPAPVVGGSLVPPGQSPVQLGQMAPVQIQPTPGAQAMPGGNLYVPAPGSTGSPQSFAVPGQPSSGSNPALDIIRTILTTPNPRGLSGVPTASDTQPTGPPLLAGVASNLEADSIKVYNDRSKYNEWEFVYDPRQDKTAVARIQGAQPAGQVPTGVVPAGQAPGFTNPNPQGPRGRGPQNPFGPPVGFPPMGPGGMPQTQAPGQGR